MDSFVSSKELVNIGLKKVGTNVLISKNSCFYGAGNISLGSHVRIDDFCILSGNIKIGNNVHISAGTFIFAGDSKVVIGNHTSISSRCGIYAISDDFSGNFLVGSMEDEKFRNVIKENIIIGDCVAIGTGTTVLPGAFIPDGVAIGAMSLVNKPLDEWYIYCGIPCKKMKKREKSLLDLLDEN